VRKYQAAYFSMWAMGEHSKDAGPGLQPPTQDLILDVTPKYEELILTVPQGAKLTVTFDFTAGMGRQRKRVQYGQSEIEFGETRLVVNPRPPSISRR
jgi:hypothetical protein